jgi:hypothetical protein
MDILQMPFFLILSMFQEYKVLAGESQRPPKIGKANDEATFLTTEVLIWHLNTLRAIIWLLRAAPNLAIDRLSTHPAANSFRLFTRIIDDVHMFN